MHHQTSISIDQTIITWLSGIILQSGPQWPGHGNIALEEQIWQAGKKHGVLALCSYRLHNVPSKGIITQSLQKRLKNFERQAAITELFRKQEIKTVLSQLNAHNIQPLLLKGSALSYCLYPEPYLRPRCDTDLFFADNDTAEQAWTIVKKMGYKRPHAVSGKFVSHEFSCYTRGRSGIPHCLDFHWKLSNNQTFARIFSFDELIKASVPVRTLHNVPTLCNMHALLYACMHRISHLLDTTGDRLIWLYDIHLLAESLSAPDWKQLAGLAIRKKIPATTFKGLQAAANTFATHIPQNILNELKNCSPEERFETTQWKHRGQAELANIQGLDSWGDRLLLIKEHLFPPGSYMFAKYQTNNKFLLPILYLTRITKGIPKLLKL